MANKTPDYQLKAAKRWSDKNKNFYKNITIRFNKNDVDDKKIIEYLDTLDNRTAKIKDLLLNEINNKKS